MRQLDGRPERSCEGKIRLNHKEKKKALKTMRTWGAKRLAYYKCRFCGYYHLGRYR